MTDRTSSPPALTLLATPTESRIDPVAAEAAVVDLLGALGQDPCDPQLRDTPRRVVASLTEMVSPVPFHLTTFPNWS